MASDESTMPSTKFVELYPGMAEMDRCSWAVGSFVQNFAIIETLIMAWLLRFNVSRSFLRSGSFSRCVERLNELIDAASLDEEIKETMRDALAEAGDLGRDRSLAVHNPRLFTTDERLLGIARLKPGAARHLTLEDLDHAIVGSAKVLHCLSESYKAAFGINPELDADISL